ncbi:MAG: hypothetical protein SW833_01370 [Cyanobacteriota bacterium]|nr:hypothetical protein [Cyanobacteriota bacterium]
MQIELPRWDSDRISQKIHPLKTGDVIDPLLMERERYFQNTVLHFPRIAVKLTF